MNDATYAFWLLAVQSFVLLFLSVALLNCSRLLVILT